MVALLGEASDEPTVPEGADEACKRWMATGCGAGISGVVSMST